MIGGEWQAIQAACSRGGVAQGLITAQREEWTSPAGDPRRILFAIKLHPHSSSCPTPPVCVSLVLHSTKSEKPSHWLRSAFLVWSCLLLFGLVRQDCHSIA